ncbi:MAG: hypothetical protein PHX18_02335 [Candidatus Gastranaerophilales bacterium]|nr:hypothetical protein [Candidatus Gastranaerophilales bacterium]
MIPSLIVYWIILQINSPDLNSYRVLLGTVCQPIIEFVSNFGVYVVENIDLTPMVATVFLILVFFLIGTLEGAVNYFEKLAKRQHQTMTINKTIEANKKQEEEYLTFLYQQQTIYLMTELNFERFTISSTPETEIKKTLAKSEEELFLNVRMYKGHPLSSNDIEDDKLKVVIFYAQEDAINFLINFEKLLEKQNNALNSIGYAISCKTVLDAQMPNAMNFFVLQILKRIINSIQHDSIYTTHSFKERYQKFGLIKGLTFISQGLYSIRGERIELFKLKLI